MIYIHIFVNIVLLLLFDYMCLSFSLFSFVILDPFPDKRYHIEVVSDAYQIKPGCIPVHREDAYRL